MSKKLLISYLSYVNDKNEDRRSKIFDESFDSLKKLFVKEKNSAFFLSVDNNSNKKTIEKINQSSIFDYKLHLKENFIDVSLLYYTAKLAYERGIEYIFYTYDDFIFYDFEFVEDCVDFLESNREVHSIRMPIFDVDNINVYNSEITPKSINPDAIRHFNYFADRNSEDRRLKLEGPLKFGIHEFYKANWHYTSRPTFWRTEYFYKVFKEMKNINVMQNFEADAGKYFYKNKMNSSLINLGVCRTFKQSERMTQGGGSYFKTVSFEKKYLKEYFDKTLIEVQKDENNCNNTK